MKIFLNKALRKNVIYFFYYSNYTICLKNLCSNFHLFSYILYTSDRFKKLFINSSNKKKKCINNFITIPFIIINKKLQKYIILLY